MSSKAKWTILKALVRLRLAEAFSGFGRKRTRKGIGKTQSGGLGGILVYVILAVFVMLSLGTTFFGIGAVLESYGMMALHFPIVIIIAFIFCFIGSVFLAQHQIFEAKDNDTMFSLPIPPRMLLVSRILSLILVNYYYEGIIVIPGAVAYGVLHGYSVPGFIFLILGSILMPLLAITLSIILAYLITLVSSRLKNSRAISLVLTVAALLAYMYFISSWTQKLEKLAMNGAEAIGKLKKFIPPAWYYGDAIHSGSALSFLIFALICIVPFVIACFIIGRNFIRIATTERGAKKIEYRGGEMKTSGSFAALARMEMGRFTGSNVYMLNSAIGLIFVVLLAFVAVFRRGEFDEMLTGVAGTGLESVIGPIIAAAFLALSAMVFISSATISLDAYTLWQLKSLPVRTREILLAKAVPHILVSAPFLLLAAVIIQFAVPMDVAWRVGVIVIPLLATVSNGLLGVIVNLRFPKFDWLTEAHAVKQGLAPMLAMLLNAVPVIILVVCFAVLVGVIGLPTWVMLPVSIVLYAVLIFGFDRILTNWGAKRFAELQS